MTETSTRSATHRTRQALAGVALLACLLSGGVAFSAGNDETNSPSFQMPKTGMQSGNITAKHEKSVEISGRGYAFHPKVEFWTDEGQQLEWKDFNRGDEVQFHLKQGKVDYLILNSPK
jgi:hypothetical protein